jgi:uncharacterized Zn finger protein (UPF0148 family)
MTIKCTKCGLVNFAGTLQCRRCGLEFSLSNPLTGNTEILRQTEEQEWEDKAKKLFEYAAQQFELKKQQEKQKRREERQLYLLTKFQSIDIVNRIMNTELQQGDSREIAIEMLGKPEISDLEVLKTKTRETWKYNHITKNQYGLVLTLENNVVTKYTAKNGALQLLNFKRLSELKLLETTYDYLEDDILEVSGEKDNLFDEAIKVVCQMGKASTSVLQRRLRIGYGRAAAIIDMMEQEDYVGAADGGKPRVVKQSAYDYVETLG